MVVTAMMAGESNFSRLPCLHHSKYWALRQPEIQAYL